MEKQKERQQKWAKVVARAWTDEHFKQRLLAEPASVLSEAGLKVPDGAQVQALENTDHLIHLVLPARPSGSDLSEEQLAADETLLVRAVPCDCIV